MPVVGHGKGFAFPYAFLPWFTAAIFRPLLGDRVVTLWLVAGTVALVAGTFFAFPELRRGWLAAATLANPALLIGLLNGQFAFVWGGAALLGAIGCWRRGQVVAATVLLAAGQTIHPAVICPIALVVVIAALPWERARPALLRNYGISLVFTLPAIYLVLRSPVFVDSSGLVKAWNFLNTVGPRCIIIAIPVILILVSRRRSDAATGMVLLGLVLVLGAIMWVPVGAPFAWRALDREPDQAMAPFLHSSLFRPGQTYRLLRLSDGRVGLYQLLRAGGRVDAEFFPESVLRRSWPSEELYSKALRERHVDVVMIWDSYVQGAHTNERDVLDHMAGNPPARCDGPLVCVRLLDSTTSYRVYSVTSAGAAPTSSPAT